MRGRRGVTLMAKKSLFDNFKVQGNIFWGWTPKNLNLSINTPLLSYRTTKSDKLNFIFEIELRWEKYIVCSIVSSKN